MVTEITTERSGGASRDVSSTQTSRAAHEVVTSIREQLDKNLLSVLDHRMGLPPLPLKREMREVITGPRSARLLAANIRDHSLAIGTLDIERTKELDRIPDPFDRLESYLPYVKLNYAVSTSFNIRERALALRKISPEETKVLDATVDPFERLSKYLPYAEPNRLTTDADAIRDRALKLDIISQQAAAKLDAVSTPFDRLEKYLLITELVGDVGFAGWKTEAMRPLVRIPVTLPVPLPIRVHTPL